jgi:hypothetical protein
MTERSTSVISHGKQSLVGRLEALRQIKEVGRKIPIQVIADALFKTGYTSLDAQAKALGLKRSTTWTIMKTKHKLGHLNNKTARCILANPHTPHSLRELIERMLEETS